MLINEYARCWTHIEISKANMATASHNFHLDVKKESRIFHPKIYLFVLRIILGSLFIYLLDCIGSYLWQVGSQVFWPGTEPTPPFIATWVLNRWTTSKVPEGNFWKGTILLLRWTCMMLWSICLFFCLDLLHQLKMQSIQMQLAG